MIAMDELDLEALETDALEGAIREELEATIEFELLAGTVAELVAEPAVELVTELVAEAIAEELKIALLEELAEGWPGVELLAGAAAEHESAADELEIVAEEDEPVVSLLVSDVGAPFEELLERLTDEDEFFIEGDKLGLSCLPCSAEEDVFSLIWDSSSKTAAAFSSAQPQKYVLAKARNQTTSFFVMRNS